MSFASFPTATPNLPAPYPALTQQALLDLVESLLPDFYLAPLQDPGPGYELLQMYAKVLARASVVLEEFLSGQFILSAQAAAKAQVDVEFSRNSAAAGAVTVKRGTVVRAPQSGREYITLEDAVFGALDLGPIEVAAEARFYGSTYNVPGPVTLDSGEVLEGEITEVSVAVQEPAYGDPTIVVAQVGDATGGAFGFLDALGRDRGLVRGAGESDAAYRTRLRQLPDTVTPDAIARGVARIMQRWGGTATVIETWSAAYQTCFDAPNETYTGIGAAYDPNLFCFDDDRPNPPFRNRWLDERDFRGAFIVVVSNLACVRDVGMIFDDTALLPAELETACGERAACAYDMTHADEANVLAGGYDGFDLPKAAVYNGLRALLREIKAGGVNVAIELEGE